jgi:hypothetical protein
MTLSRVKEADLLGIKPAPSSYHTTDTSTGSERAFQPRAHKDDSRQGDHGADGTAGEEDGEKIASANLVMQLGTYDPENAHIDCEMTEGLVGKEVGKGSDGEGVGWNLHEVAVHEAP